MPEATTSHPAISGQRYISPRLDSARQGHVQKAVRQQKAVVERYPNAQASRAFLQLAMAICALPPIIVPSGQIQFFWQRLFR